MPPRKCRKRAVGGEVRDESIKNILAGRGAWQQMNSQKN